MMESVSLLPFRHVDKAWINCLHLSCISSCVWRLSGSLLSSGRGTDFWDLSFLLFPPLPDLHVWKCSFRSALALEGLSCWVGECWAILANHITVCLKHLNSEMTCTVTIHFVRMNCEDVLDSSCCGKYKNRKNSLKDSSVNFLTI